MSEPNTRDLRLLYARELAWLREAGQEFAARHPKMAFLLGRQDVDPSVERLLQGVAFLNASLRSRFEEEQPEIAQDLLQVIFPQAVRPLPSMTVLQFTLPEGETQARVVPDEAEVASDPVPLGDGAQEPCRFRVVGPTPVPPVRVVDAEMLVQRQSSLLRVVLQLQGNLTAARLEKAPLRSLRFFLSGDEQLPVDLLLFLNHRRDGSPRVRDPATGAVVLDGLPPPRQLGLEPGERLLPSWEDAVEGYRLLYELFAFPQRFLFVEFHGLEGLHRLGPANTFTLEVPFGTPFPEPARVRPQSLRLGCAPALNLFPHLAEPIRREPYVEDHRLIPSGDLDRRRPRLADATAQPTRARRFEIYAVRKVTGKIMGQSAERRYDPLLQVAAAGAPLSRPANRWYNLRLRSDPSTQSFDPWLVLSMPEAPERVEILSAELLCTNARLPVELRVGDLKHPRALVPTGVQVTNILRPTPGLPPPLGRQLAGRLVGQLALGRSTLADRDALLRWLDAFNFRAVQEELAQSVHLRRAEAIGEVRSLAVDRLVPLADLPWSEAGGSAGRRFGSALARGVELHVSVRMSLLGAGEASLLGSVLDRALAAQSGLGTFTRLVIHDQDQSVEDLEWAPRIGQRTLI